MPKMPFDDWDPDERGSRFTWRPAVVVLAGEVSEARLRKGLTAQDVVADTLGDDLLKEHPALGAPEATDGAIGRGAEGWAPVLEWFGDAAGAGVVGSLSWATLKLMGRGASAVITLIRDRKNGPRIFVSRGMAMLLAIDAVLDRHRPSALSVEAVEEPSAIAGVPTHELNYVGVEPWIVLLIDFETKIRYMVVVRPNGEISGSIEFPLEEFEDLYSQVPRSTSEH